jgi:hypothetical protein
MAPPRNLKIGHYARKQFVRKYMQWMQKAGYQQSSFPVCKDCLVSKFASHYPRPSMKQYRLQPQFMKLKPKINLREHFIQNN